MRRRTRERLLVGGAIAGAALIIIVTVIATRQPIRDTDESDAIATARPEAGVVTPTPATSAGTATTPRPFPSFAPPAAPGQPVPTAIATPVVQVTPKPVDPGPAQRTREGRYRYSSQVNGRTYDSILTVDAKQNGRRIEDLDGELINIAAWDDRGKYGLNTRFGQGDQSIECDWEPDIRKYLFPMKVGTSWTFVGKCFLFEKLSMTLEGTSKVALAGTLRIGNKDVDVWVIRTNSRITFRSSNGDKAIQKVVAEDGFAPKYGLSAWTAEYSQGEDPATGAQVSSSTVRTLRSVDPI